MSKQETYDQFARRADKLPLFFQPGWLNAVAGPGNWSATTAHDKEGKMVGVWPFQLGKKWSLFRLAYPPLMSQVGPWLSYPPNLKQASRHDFEWHWLPRLAQKLPAKFLFIEAKMSYSQHNWLPFQRLGWRQTTRYSYVHPAAWDQEYRWAALAGRQRTTIRKAQKTLKVSPTDDMTAVYELLQASFQHRGSGLPLSRDTLDRIHAYLQRTDQGRAYLVSDPSGRLHAGGYLAWDRLSIYNLIQGSDPELRNSGAAALALWEATAEAADRQLDFDFEGSQVPGIEEFFRSFGGEMWAYHEIRKIRWR